MVDVGEGGIMANNPTKDEVNDIISRVLKEIEVITEIVSKENFSLDDNNYDLKLHYRIMTECISMLREMLIQDYKFF